MSAPNATLIAACPTHEVYLVMYPGFKPGVSIRAFYVTHYPGSEVIFIESATRFGGKAKKLSHAEKNEIAEAIRRERES